MSNGISMGEVLKGLSTRKSKKLNSNARHTIALEGVLQRKEAISGV